MIEIADEVNAAREQMLSELDALVLPRFEGTELTNKAIADRYGITERAAAGMAERMVKDGKWSMIQKRKANGQTVNTYTKARE